MVSVGAESFNGFGSQNGSRAASPEPGRTDDFEDFGFGSDAGDEPEPDGPFDSAAQVDGLEIWRVEGPNVVQKFNEPMADRPAPNVGVDAHRGALYTGDVYGMLWSSVSRGCALQTLRCHAMLWAAGGKRSPDRRVLCANVRSLAPMSL